MENIILSLLMIKNMTIYEMRSFIQRNLSFICSDSIGSIQSAIKKLLEKECISVCEYEQKGVLKKEYRILQAGLEQFREWIEVPMNLQKMKNMEEGKFFFMGIAPKEKRIASLKEYLESLRKERDKLLEIEQHIEEIKNDVIERNVRRIREEGNLEKYLLEVSGANALDDVVKNIFDYQVYHLQYGIKRLEDDILFYETIMQKESRKNV